MLQLCTLLFLWIPAEPERIELRIQGVERETLVYFASKKTESASPVVFVFHGHGGTMQNAARRMNLHSHWPEAIVVYPQGLPTVGKFDPKGTRPGWQKTKDDEKGRDLEFVDAILTELKKKQAVDESRIYATGL